MIVGNSSKTLALMRHAKSSWADAGQQDFDRPLNARGERTAPLIAEWLQGVQNFRPEVALVSAARRTQQTWDLIAPTLALSETAVVHRQELYLASEGRLCEFADAALEHADSVLVVAHNPGIEQLLWEFAQELRRHDDSVDLVGFNGLMPTAAVGLISGELVDGRFRPQRWNGFATPKLLEQ